MSIDPSFGPSQVVAGQPFTATLLDPGGIVGAFGARVEVPVTRAIASYWQQATLVGGVWSVTLDGVVAAGSYELVWMESTDPPAHQLFVPLVAVDALTPIGGDFPPIDVAQITPTVDDIALLEKTRTRDDDSGEFLGTFTDQTFPTAADVQKEIGKAIEQVMGQIPDAIDPEFYGRAKWAVELTTAIIIETSYFRVQGQGGTSPSSGAVLTYRQLLAETMAALGQTAIGTGMRLQ